MISIFSFSETIYSSVYVYATTIMCIIMIFYIISIKQPIFKKDNGNLTILSLFVLFLLVLFFGYRPTGVLMGDTYMYIHSYFYRQEYSNFSLKEEWLWNNLNIFCKELGFNSTEFFILVASLYVGGMFLLCWAIMRNNNLIGFLFCVASFSFYGYGMNGIRNGLACSVLLFAFIFFIESNNYKYIIGIFLLFIAYGIHRSTLMPIICLLLSISIIKKTDVAIYIWLTSIVVSLVMGNFVGDFMASTGLFEEKMNYFQDAEFSDNANEFSSTGFRWDFLLYSSMPVLMTWYVTIKRDFQDRTFNLIANTYILSNAIWIMVIRASFSNRFAYLSWFLYPFVIAYPLLRMNLWDDNQNVNLSLILSVYVGFTLIMFLL